MSYRLISLPPPRTFLFRHLGVLAAAWLLVAATSACGRSVTNSGSKLADASSMDARNQDDRMIVDTLPNLKADAESPADSGLKTADASSADARNQDDRMTVDTLPDLKPDGLAAFWRPHFHCDEGFSWALAGHVAVSIGARGLFRAQPPDAEGALFFALMELPGITSQA